MRIMAVSGWGQPHDALASIAPDATHVDYVLHDTVENALAAIAEEGKNHDIAIGWSQGGQLLTRAIATGLFKPKKLVLIATPFQFVKNTGGGIGMPRDAFEKFRANYAANPERTLNKAWGLIAKDDTMEDTVCDYLSTLNKHSILAKNWLAWLHLLDGFSCETLPAMQDFPPTLLVHGDRDAVVWHEQSQHFLQKIPGARLETFKGCGHAPHWHNAPLMKQLVYEHIHV